MMKKLFHKIRRNIHYSLWQLFYRKNNIRNYARKAQTRGDLKYAFAFWSKAAVLFPEDFEVINSREYCFNMLNGRNFLSPAEGDLIIEKIRDHIKNFHYDEALNKWLDLINKNPTPSGKLYDAGGELFLNVGCEKTKFGNSEAETSLIKMLLTQEPSLIRETNLYSSLCNILFRLKTSNAEQYKKIWHYLNEFLSSNQSLAETNTISACTFVAFDFCDNEKKQQLLEKFYTEITSYKQWGIILYVHNTENIKIFSEILQKRIDSNRSTTAEELVTNLYLASAVDQKIYDHLMQIIPSFIPKLNPQTPFFTDLEYISGKRDLYQECLSQFKDASFPPNITCNDSKRLKIAICVSGQLRGFKTAFKSWNFNNPDHDLHYFVHSWNDIGRKYPNPPRDTGSFSGEFLQQWRNNWIRLGEEEMKKRYNNIFKFFHEGNEINEQELKLFYNAEAVVLEDDKSSKFADFTNPQKMYYKIYECHKLAKNSGKQFDLIVRIRPDRETHLVNFDWNKIYQTLHNQKTILVDTGPYMHPHSEYVIGDQMAIGTPEMMDRYAMTYKITEYVKKNNLKNLPKKYCGHINFSYYTLYQGIKIINTTMVDPIPFHLGAYCDTELINQNMLLESLQKDLSHSNIDDFDKALLDAILQDIQQSKGN